MVKTADVGLRAKNNLAKEIATPMSPAAAKGERGLPKKAVVTVATSSVK